MEMQDGLWTVSGENMTGGLIFLVDVKCVSCILQKADTKRELGVEVTYWGTVPVKNKWGGK